MMLGMKYVNEWYSQLAKALYLALAIRRCFANIGGAYKPSDLVMLVSNSFPESCPDHNPLHLVHKRLVVSMCTCTCICARIITDFILFQTSYAAPVADLCLN